MIIHIVDNHTSTIVLLFFLNINILAEFYSYLPLNERACVHASMLMEAQLRGSSAT